MREKARRLRALLGEELPYSENGGKGEIVLSGGMTVSAVLMAEFPLFSAMQRKRPIRRRLPKGWQAPGKNRSRA